VSVDAQTHHAVLDVHLMVLDNQKMRVIKSMSELQPADTQAVCNLQTNPEDNQQYELGL